MNLNERVQRLLESGVLDNENAQKAFNAYIDHYYQQEMLDGLGVWSGILFFIAVSFYVVYKATEN